MFHLYLNYYFAWIASGKVSVVTIVRARLRSVLSTASQETLVDESTESLSKSCITAANKILVLFEHVVSSGNLTRFSFPDFQGCSIATIIVLLSGILERDATYHSRVEFGLDCLRKMSGVNPTARTGVLFVEALKSITDEARAKLEANSPGIIEEPQDEIMHYRPSDYARWAHWLSNTEKQQPGPQIDDSTGPTSMEVPEISIDGGMADPGEDGGGRLDASVMASPPWDEAAALQLQGLSASAFGMAIPPAGLREPSASPMDLYLPSAAFSDDQLYLMGLTGMDVLDFTEDLP